jgi:hypothetical protein
MLVTKKCSPRQPIRIFARSGMNMFELRKSCPTLYSAHDEFTGRLCVRMMRGLDCQTNLPLPSNMPWNDTQFPNPPRRIGLFKMEFPLCVMCVDLFVLNWVLMDCCDVVDGLLWCGWWVDVMWLMGWCVVVDGGGVVGGLMWYGWWVDGLMWCGCMWVWIKELGFQNRFL